MLTDEMSREELLDYASKIETELINLNEKYNIDINELQNAKQQLERNFDLLKIAGDIAKFGGWSVDLDSNISTWSDEVADIHEMPHGYSPQVHDGINFYTQDYKQKITDVFTACAKDGIPYDEEMQIVTSSGRVVWVRTIGKAVRDENGKIFSVNGAFQDISEKKEINEKLRKSNAEIEHSNKLMDYIIQHNKSGVAVFDTKMNYIFVSKKYIKDYRLKETELIGKNHYKVFPEIPDKWKEIHQRALSGDVLSNDDDIFYREDGSVDYIRWECRPWYQSDGSIGGIILYSEVITESKRVERALRESEALIRTVMDNLPIGIAVNSVDPTVNFSYMNDRFPQIYCTTREALSKDDAFWEAVYEDEAFREEIRKKVLEGLSSGDKSKMRWDEVPITRKGKETRYINAVGIPLIEQKKIISTVWDVTERVKAEKELKASEEKFRNLFYNHAAVKLIIDPNDAKIIDANYAASRFYGWSIEQLKTMKATDINTLSPDDIAKEMNRTRIEGKIRFEFKHLKADGSIVDVEVFSSRVLLDGKERLHSIIHDITEKKKVEAQIRLLSKAIEMSSVSVSITNIDGEIIYVNKYFEKFTGYSSKEVIGKNPRILKSGLQSQEFYRNLWETILSGNTWEGEMQNKRKNGEVYWVKCLISPIFDENGKITNFVAIKDDISESKKVLNKIQNLSEIIENSVNEVYVFDANTLKFLYVNKGALANIGYSKSEILNMTPIDIKPKFAEEEFRQTLKPLIDGDIDSYHFETTHQRKDLTEYVADIHLQRTDFDGINAVAAIILDVTDRKVYENELIDKNHEMERQYEEYYQLNEVLRITNFELEVAKTKAEESSKLKTAFINNISHEIRTPLNGIIGFGDLILNIDMDEFERRDLLIHLRKSTDRLIQTITDFIDISLIQTSTLEVHKHFVNLAEILDEFLELSQRRCHKSELKVQIQIPENCYDIVLNTDNELLHKILWHLTDNAIKFTENGVITIGTKLLDGAVEIFVSDTGKGIAEDKQKLIFEAFMQEDVALNRGYEGSGLGLSIVSGFVKSLGGNIKMDTEKGEGTKISFTIPYSNPVAGGTINKRSGKPLVLAAEDDDINFDYLEYILKKCDCDYIHVRNGIDAVEKAEQHPEISFVLMDIKMPKMNGIEATKKIKEFRPDLPIIALTAYAVTGDEHNIRSAGCDDYYAKPINYDTMMKLVNKYKDLTR